MKIMNQIKMFAHAISITSGVIVLLSFVSNVIAEEKLSFNLDSVKMISLDLKSGAQVNIETWEKQKVEITYDDETQDINNYKVKINESNSGLKISSKAGQMGDMQLWFNLKVPKDTQVCLLSNGGNIKVSGLTGGLKNCSSELNNSDGSVVINSKGGSINVDSAPHGANTKTAGGSINVKGASKFVVAKTGGGSINIETKNGSVEASTGAGKIKVVVLQESGALSDINLASGLGDIWLYVPKDYSMNLDIEIGYTNETNGQFKVDSAFPLTLVNNHKKSVSGTPRQYLKGQYKTGDGRHSVKIKTTNSNVYIREI